MFKKIVISVFLFFLCFAASAFSFEDKKCVLVYDDINTRSVLKQNRQDSSLQISNNAFLVCSDGTLFSMFADKNAVAEQLKFGNSTAELDDKLFYFDPCYFSKSDANNLMTVSYQNRFRKGPKGSKFIYIGSYGLFCPDESFSVVQQFLQNGGFQFFYID